MAMLVNGIEQPDAPEIKLKECCGVQEITGISHGTPKDALRTLILNRVVTYLRAGHPLEGTYSMYLPGAGRRIFSCAYLLFTQALGGPEHSRIISPYGDKFRDYILSLKVGSVTQMGGEGINPNTGRKITLYLWELDHAALGEFAKEAGYLQEAYKMVHSHAPAPPQPNFPTIPPSSGQASSGYSSGGFVVPTTTTGRGGVAGGRG